MLLVGAVEDGVGRHGAPEDLQGVDGHVDPGDVSVSGEIELRASVCCRDTDRYSLGEVCIDGGCRGRRVRAIVFLFTGGLCRAEMACATVSSLSAVWLN